MGHVVGTCVPVKGLEENSDELDKGKGLKRREIPGRVHYKFSTDQEHEIQSDVNKNLVLTIKNLKLLS